MSAGTKRKWEVPTSLHISKRARPEDLRTTVQVKTMSVFRVQLICAVLAQRPVVISGIREDSERPGLTDAEISFARLLALVTNGSKLIINETATRISFVPGVPTGGVAKLDVNADVNLSWLIEGLIPLAPFCKEPMRVTLNGGLTDSDDEVGINYLRNVTFKLLEKFGVAGASIECHSRGFGPNGGGSVSFFCPIIRKHLTIPLDLDKTLKVLRVRGTAQSSRVNPQLANRVAIKARSELDSVIPDAFVNTDCRSSRTGDAGASPGYGLTLWCELVDAGLTESTHVDRLPITSIVGTSGAYRGEDDTPEKVGSRVSKQLLKQIASKGSVDILSQSLVILLMATCPEEVVRCNVGGTLTEHAIGTLRAVAKFLSIKFNISNSSDGTILLTCVGSGIGNFARRVT